MKIETRKLAALVLAIAVCGGCAAERHKLDGTEDGPDGGSGAAEDARNEQGAGGETGAGSGAAGGAGGTGDSGTGGEIGDGSGAAGGAGGTDDSGTGGVASFSGTIGNPPDASDASDEDSGDGSSCSCTPQLHGSSLVVGTVDLSCFCARFGCLTYDEARSPTRCVGFSATWVRTFEGCDLVEIRIGTGDSGVSYTYDGTTHELVGARKHEVVPTFACADARAHVMSASTRPTSLNCTLLDEVNVCQ